jgi:hypothetical protein
MFLNHLERASDSMGEYSRADAGLRRVSIEEAYNQQGTVLKRQFHLTERYMLSYILLSYHIVGHGPNTHGRDAQT